MVFRIFSGVASRGSCVLAASAVVSVVMTCLSGCNSNGSSQNLNGLNYPQPGLVGSGYGGGGPIGLRIDGFSFDPSQMLFTWEVPEGQLANYEIQACQGSARYPNCYAYARIYCIGLPYCQSKWDDPRDSKDYTLSPPALSQDGEQIYYYQENVQDSLGNAWLQIHAFDGMGQSGPDVLTQ